MRFRWHRVKNRRWEAFVRHCRRLVKVLVFLVSSLSTFHNYQMYKVTLSEVLVSYLHVTSHRLEYLFSFLVQNDDTATVKWILYWLFPLCVFLDFVYLVSSRLVARDPFFDGVFATSFVVNGTAAIETVRQPQCRVFFQSCHSLVCVFCLFR